MLASRLIGMNHGPAISGISLDISSAFVNFGEFTVTDNASDTTSPYSVSELQVDHTGSARLYIAHKATAVTTFYSDAPIAAIQILDNAGTTVLYQYYFGGNTNQGWAATFDAYGAGTNGINKTPTQMAAYSYGAIYTNSAVDTFGLASSTASSGTGAVDGIAAPSGPMTLGNATTAQSTNAYYVYRETTGSTLNEATFMRSPIIYWTNGMKVRVAYIIGNAPFNAQEVDDTFFMGIA